MQHELLIALLFIFALLPLACADTAAQPANSPAADQILAGTQRRIEQHRKGNITVVVLDGAQPVADATVQVEQTSHEFLFGCNIFGLRLDDTLSLQQAYQQRFTALFNYATLPFYWSSYEPQRGKPQRAELTAMARWCASHGVRPKGHPLVWHETVPPWAPHTVGELVLLLRARVESIVSGFAGLVDTWDVINESTVSPQVDNAVGRWVKEIGPVNAAGEAMSWARLSNPHAALIVNDFRLAPEYQAQIQGLIDSNRAPDAIGIQSHLHGGEWPLERAWEVCETYGRFGRPIHFTETTVLSGRLKSASWEPKSKWPTTTSGAQRQAAYVERFYRVLFSHPAVAAITWWDFTDRGAWQGAPAGLVRADMSPKPAYERLLRLVKTTWWTQVKGRTGADGEMRCRGFYGTHRIAATARDGRKASAEVRLFKADQRRVTLRLCGKSAGDSPKTRM
jgi:GH35 family endo-1,4-beta-xylanase